MQYRKIVVYSVVSGGYDEVLPPRRTMPGVRYLLFSDGLSPAPSGWTSVPIPSEAEGLAPMEANRWCKFFPHKFIDECDVSIYIDGNIRIIGRIEPLLSEFMASHAGIGLFRHPDRDNIREEALACKRLGKLTRADAEAIDRQVEAYAREVDIDSAGLTENGVIFRNHGSDAMKRAMELWWAEFRRGVRRDQISLPWVLAKTGVRVHRWRWAYRRPNRVFLGPILPHYNSIRHMRFARHRYRLRAARKNAKRAVLTWLGRS